MCLHVCSVVSLWVQCLQEIPSWRSGVVGMGSTLVLVVFSGLCITGSIMVYICVDDGNSCPHILFFLFPSFFLYLKFDF